MTTQPKITVGNVRDGLLPEHDIHLYCGRGNAPAGMIDASLGNPYPMNNESERDQVCRSFECWLNASDEGQKKWPIINRIAQRVQEGKSVALYCHCAPKRCHCDTIRELALVGLE